MDIAGILPPDRVVDRLKAANKGQLLSELARRMADASGLTERVIRDRLSDREQLGSTGVGGGIAIPHARFTGLAGCVGLFARLDRPLEFDAIDGRPVDLVFCLLSPEGQSQQHLRLLASISRLLRDDAVSARLRGADGAAALLAILSY